MKFETEFNHSRFQQYVDFLKANGTSSATIDRKLSSLNSFQTFLIKKAYLKKPVTVPPSILRQPESIAPKRNFLSRYLILGTLIAILLGLGYGVYSQTILKAKKELAYSTASAPVRAGRVLSFQGRLTDSSGNPISSSTNILFKLYTSGAGGTELYTSSIGNSQTVVPDENGIFSVVIGKSHGTEIPPEVFSENAEVWLEITAGGELMDPRQQIATVGYALNSETLQGLPPSASGLKDTVLVIDSLGNLNLGETSPTIKSTSGTLGIEGQALLLNAVNGLDTSNIRIDPTNPNGAIQLITTGNGSSNSIVATNANLATGNLITGKIVNDNRGYNFLTFENYDIGTTNLSTRFSVSASGNVYISNNLNTGGTVTFTGLPVGTGTTVIYINSSGNLISGTLPAGITYTASTGITLVGNDFQIDHGFANTWTGIQTFQNNFAVGSSALISNLNAYYLDGLSSSSFLQTGYTGFFTTALNGLQAIGSTGVGLGGTLTQNTQIGTSSFGLLFGVGNTQSLFIGTSGFVGIGTTNPTVKLDVSGAINSAWASGGWSGSHIGMGSGPTQNYLMYISSGNAFLESYYGDLYLQTKNSQSLKIGTSGITSITINPTGLVGIGTSSPTSKLHVVGNGYFSTSLSVGTSLDVGTTATIGSLVLDSTAIGTGTTVLYINSSGVVTKGVLPAGTVYTASAGVTQVGNDFRLDLGSTNVWLASQIFNGGIGVTGNLTVGGTFVSVGSTNLVTNLNADLLDGLHSSAFVGIGQTGNFLTSLTGGSGIAITGTGIGRTITASLTNGLNFFTGAIGVSSPTCTGTDKLQWTGTAFICATDVGSSYTAGTGLTLSSTNVFALNLGSTNVWLASQIFNGGIGVTGNLTVGGTFVSVGSTNLVTNLNAQYLNGHPDTYYLDIGNTGDFIRNQFASAQTANYWISGNGLVGKFGIGATHATALLNVVGNANITTSLTIGTSLDVGTTATIGSLVLDSTAIGTGSTVLYINSSGVVTKGVLPAGSIYTASNGITLAGSNFKLGGTLTENTTIGTSSFSLSFKFDNTGAYINASNIGFGTSGGTTDISMWRGNPGILEIGNLEPIASFNSNTYSIGLGDYSGAIGGAYFNINNDIGSSSFSFMNGNVGINTVNPAYELHVVGDIGTTGNLTVGGSVAFTALPLGTGSTVLYINSSGVVTKGVLPAGGSYTADNGLHLSGSIFGLGGTLTDTDYTNINIGAGSSGLAILGINNNTHALVIRQNGNVGIGTTAPQHKLEVVGDVAANTYYDLTDANLFLDIANADPNSSSLSLDRSGSIKWNSYYHTVGTSAWTTISNGYASKIESGLDGLLFATSDIATSETAIAWQQNLFLEGGSGYVGIGTSNPQYQLEVLGDVFVSSNTYIKELIVEKNTSTGSLSFAKNIPIGGSNILAFVGTGISGDVGYISTAGWDKSTSDDYASWNLDASLGTAQSITSGNTAYFYGGNGIGTSISGTDSLTIGIGGTLTKAAFTNINIGSGSSGLAFLGINNNTQALVIQQNGSVGIGTTSPSQKLEINGNLTFSSSAIIRPINATGIGNSLYISGGHSLSSTGGNLFLSGGNGTNFLQSGGNVYIDGGLGDLPTNNGNILLATNNNGNVGIGTSNPSEHLSIYGNIDDDDAISIGNSNSGTAAAAALILTANGGTTTLRSVSVGYTAWASPHMADSFWVNTSLSKGINLSSAHGNGAIRFFSGGRATTNERMTIASNGNVGIGNTAPKAKLHIEGVGVSGLVFIKNTQTGHTVAALTIQIGSTSIGVTGGEFVRFLNTSGTKVGRIRTNALASSVAFATSAVNDFAEYVRGNEPTEATDLVAFHGDKYGKARDGEIIAGTHSNIATYIGNENIANEPNAFPLALVGIVDLKVNSKNGPINPGDPISTSHIAGVGAKATKAGRIVGQAMESYSNPDINRTGLIKIIVQPSYYDPDVFLTDSGQVNINYNISPEVLSSLGYLGSKNEIEAATYSLTDSTGKLVTRVANFAKLSTAKLTAGLITTKNLIAENIISETTKSKKISTAVITPLSDISDTITIEGNASVSGTLTAENIIAKDATFSTVYADQIIGQEGNFGQVMTDKIANLREEIKSLLASDSATATPSAIAIAADTWDTSVATFSSNLTLDNLALTNNLIVGAQLTVNGQSNLNSANVSNVLTVGQIAISDNILETTADNLYIQPSGLGSIHFLNDRLVLNSDGNVTINGNLNVNGSLIATLLKTDSIETKDLTAEKINISTSSAIIASALPAEVATQAGTLATNASIGTVTLASGQTEITIENNRLTPASMVYLTPNGSTQNQVVYVKSKDVGSSIPSFTIGIDSTLPTDLSINWWLIN